MTNKFTSRKRTIRRIDVSNNSRSASPNRKGTTASSKINGEVGRPDEDQNLTLKKPMIHRSTSTTNTQDPASMEPQKKSSLVRALTKAKDSLRRPPSTDNFSSRSLLFSSRSSRNDTSSTSSHIPSRHSQTSSTLSTPTQSGPSSPTKLTSSTVPPPQLRRTASMRSMRSVMTTCTTNTVVPAEEAEPKASNYPHEHLVSNLQVCSRIYPHATSY